MGFNQGVPCEAEKHFENPECEFRAPSCLREAAGGAAFQTPGGGASRKAEE